MYSRRRVFSLAFGTLLALAASGLAMHAHAQGKFPDRPIKIIVPAGAGSTLDFIARQVGDRLPQRLGQPVVVENKVGASGMIAYELVARSKPDGYTLGMVQAGFISNRFLFKSVPYDEFRDYVPVAMVARSPMVLVMRSDSAASNMAELQQLAKSKPNTLTYAAVNGANQLNSELVKRQLHLDLRAIPYKDTPQAISDVLAGHVDAHLAAYTSALPLLKSGKLRIYLTLGRKRIAAFPDVPSSNELGMAGDVQTWAGFVAPAGTPADIVDLLRQHIDKVSADHAMREKLELAGYEPYTLTPQAFTAMMRREIDIYGKVAQEVGMKPE